MPYKDPNAQRLYQKQLMRERRAAARTRRAVEVPRDWPEDPAAALAEWASSTLVVPPGHERAGEPMTLPGYAVDFFRDALQPTCSEAFLSVSRKSAKSAAVAVLLLGHIAEGAPLVRAGFRGVIGSVSRDKAAEIHAQMWQISEASKLRALRFTKVPRQVESATGIVQVVSADSSSGHALGADLAVLDEIGLLHERNREYVAGLRSSVSAKGGRFLALSVMGMAPFTREMVDRRDDPATVVHLYQADAGCAIDDEDQWRKACPVLGEIKSLQYYRDASRRALLTPADESAFRTYELNLPTNPAQHTIVSLTDWQSIVVAEDDLPPRDPEGGCVIGIDLGGPKAFTAAVVVWPSTGRMEVYGAVGDTPSLEERSASDGARGLYQEMHRRGELRVYGGMQTPVSEFIYELAGRLHDQKVLKVGGDLFRKGDFHDALKGAGVDWWNCFEPRAIGGHKLMEAAADVRAFIDLVLERRIRIPPNLLMEYAIGESMLRFDPAGNPMLDKQRSHSRIDPVQAGVIACGLMKKQLRRPAARAARFVVA